MKPSFGTCIFKMREKPRDCENGMEHRQCSADDWGLVKCFIDHYGNLLVADAPIRLIDAFTHIIIANENEEIDGECEILTLLNQQK